MKQIANQMKQIIGTALKAKIKYEIPTNMKY